LLHDAFPGYDKALPDISPVEVKDVVEFRGHRVQRRRHGITESQTKSSLMSQRFSECGFRVEAGLDRREQSAGVPASTRMKGAWAGEQVGPRRPARRGKPVQIAFPRTGEGKTSLHSSGTPIRLRVQLQRLYLPCRGRAALGSPRGTF